MPSLRVLALALFALSFAACAVNPVSGRPEVTLMSSSEERKLGDEEAKKVAAEMGLVDEPRLVSYVRQVGARVAAGSPRQDVAYTFDVVGMPEPNAFALPGGHVYVTRGLLVLLVSEDELAGVLGHEIGHVAARHSVQQMSRAAPIGILTGIGALATGIVSPFLGDVIGGVGATANALVLAPYGRDQEREADRVGAELAAKAGYDPAALASSLHTLEREDKLSNADAASRGSFFATHPPLPERVSNVEIQAAGLARGKPDPVAGSPAVFLERLDGVVVGPSAAEGVFQDQTFVHPDLDVALTFPAGWKTRNTRAAVGALDPDRRATIVLEAVGTGDDPAQAVAAFDAEAKSDLSSRLERVDVGGRRGVHTTARARTNDGPLALDLTWVAQDGHIFRVLGATKPSDFDRFADTFRTTARSLRRPSAAERARVREARLRLVRGRTGETLASLAARTDSVWKPEMVAVANALPDAATPVPDRKVKVAESEPYAARP
jgi:predicted Zn-dependent protease